MTPCQVGRAKDWFGRLGRFVTAETRPGAGDLGDFTTQHPGHELEPRDLGNLSGVDPATVAQDGHPVAHAEDLIQPVRDVDDGDAIASEEADDFHQALDLAGLERRGRLVHDHDAVVS